MKAWQIEYVKFSFTVEELKEFGKTDILGISLDNIESDKIFLNVNQMYQEGLIDEETARNLDKYYSRTEIDTPEEFELMGKVFNEISTGIQYNLDE